MKLKPALVAAAVVLASQAPAHAQTLGIGTSGQGTVGYSMGAAVAGVLAPHGVDAVVQPAAGTSAFLPLIATGELDFGFVNALEIWEAAHGEVAFEGRPLEDLRMAARLFPFRVGVFVRDDSDIESIADLEGRRLTYGFTSQLTLNRVLEALLATEEVTSDDFQQVMVPNVVRGADDFAAGQADAAFFAMGAGKVAEVDASVGGIRFLPVPQDEEAVARMQALVPQAYVEVLEPAPNLPGVHEPMGVMSYDYVLVTGAHVPEEVVKQVIMALHEDHDGLVEAFASFREMDPDAMYIEVGVPYHEGALEAFRELGQLD